MRILPNLEYLNGLPVDRDALEEDVIEDDDINHQLDAVQQEAMNNVDHSQVEELPDEEDSQYDDTHPGLMYSNSYNNPNRTGVNDTSLMSAMSATKN